MLKRRKRTLTVILSLLLAMAFAVVAHAAPTQNANGAYQLATADDMLWFREQVAAGEVDMNAMLTADIDLSGVVWKPIWNEQAAGGNPIEISSLDNTMQYWYNGTFDGNGKQLIVNLQNSSLVTCLPDWNDTGAADVKAAALFLGLSDQAVVKNLSVTGQIIFAGNSMQNEKLYAAAVAVVNRGVIYNVAIKDLEAHAYGYPPVSGAFWGFGSIGAVAALSYGDNAIIDSCSAESSRIYIQFNSHAGFITGRSGMGAAIVKNCMVADSTIQSDQSGLLGVITGVLLDGTISACSVEQAALAGNTSSSAFFMGGIAGRIRRSAYFSEVAMISDCVVSDCTFTVGSDADTSSTSALRAGGITGAGGESELSDIIQNCVVQRLTGVVASSYGLYAGGIAGFIGHMQVSQSQVKDFDLKAVHNGRYSTAGDFRIGGLAGYVGLGAGIVPMEVFSALKECALENASIDVRTEATVANAVLYIGALAGRVYAENHDPLSADALINCAALGNIVLSAHNANPSATSSDIYIGGLAGSNACANVNGNVMGDFTIVSGDATGSKTNWYIGSLLGEIRANSNSDAYLVDNLYDQAIALSDTVGNRAGAAVYRHEDNNTSFNSADLANAASLFASFFKGGELELAQGATLDLELEAFAGTLGINLAAASWASSNPSVLSVTPATGANVTISALAPGTATLTCTFDLNGEEEELTLTVVVPETPEYAYITAKITGTPEDGIYPGEAVDLIYDFSPYIAIPDIDNSGMALSGLLAAIVDGKVVLTGVEAGPAGTYSYIVKLQGTDGSIIRQTVYVTIQGGSRPTGDPTYGGGSSNCNAGFGAMALLSLLGMVSVLKRK